MKFFRIFLISLLIIFTAISCKKNSENLWNIKLEQKTPVKVTDISKEYYNEKVPLEGFQQKYPWFQGSVSNDDFVKRRTDSSEVKIYQEATKKINIQKLEGDLSNLFGHVKYYFPNFKNPQVYLFSSGLRMIEDPIIYDPRQGFLFVDISAFLGDKNENYKGLELYLQKSMNPENLIPKISEAIGMTIVPYDPNTAKFIDQMVYEGKLMTLQDAFIPEVSDNLKMHYTKEQYQWAKENEGFVWNYFVENDLVYSGDSRLVDRFIAAGPFSKFYTKVDQESSPRMGSFIGWEICRKFFNEKPETKLQEFLKMNGTDIMNASEYRPEMK